MNYKHSDTILEIYHNRDAVWFFDYEGDPTAPHVELTGGSCSDGYVNSALVTSVPGTLSFIVSELMPYLPRADWVVGSPYAAITFSYEVARQMGAMHGHAEKDARDPKRLRWSRFAIPEGATVLQAEELITTFGTTLTVRQAIEEGNHAPVRFLPVVGTIIYRPPTLDVPPPLEVCALVEREIRTWTRDACPLHRQGSPALRPKAKEHWTELTRKQRA